MLDDLRLDQIADPHLREVIQRLMNLVEELSRENQQLREKVQQLQDETNRLKGEQGRPKRPAKRPEPHDHSSEAERRMPRGRVKAAKNPSIPIDREETRVVDPALLPPDAEFKGYEEVIVQEVRFHTDNVRFRKENWYVSYQSGEADSPHQGAEFAPSSPVVHSEFADLGERGELPVNWPAADPRTEGRLPLPDAEFTEFTRDGELVHPPVAASDDPEFTAHTAPQCGSSPEFTASSPAGSPSQFTSSPSPRFWKRGQGELAKSDGDEPLPDEPPPGWHISQAPQTGRWWATNGKGLGEYHRTRESALAWAWTNTTA